MASGRMYSIIMLATGISVVKTLMRLSAPSDAVVIVHKIKVSNLDLETSEMLQVILQKVTSDGTGTGATINPRQTGSPTFGGTAVVDLTAEPTGGTVLDVNGENALNGWLWEDTPEEQIVLSPTERLAVKLNAAPAASMSMAVVALIEELGG